MTDGPGRKRRLTQPRPAGSGYRAAHAPSSSAATGHGVSRGAPGGAHVPAPPRLTAGATSRSACGPSSKAATAAPIRDSPAPRFVRPAATLCRPRALRQQ